MSHSDASSASSSSSFARRALRALFALTTLALAVAHCGRSNEDLEKTINDASICSGTEACQVYQLCGNCPTLVAESKLDDVKDAEEEIDCDTLLGACINVVDPRCENGKCIGTIPP